MRTLLLLLIMCTVFALQAQVWCPPQAQWTYDANDFTSWGYTRFTNVGDTTLAGQSCRKVIREWNRYDFVSAMYYEDTLGMYYTRVENGLAMIWDGIAFDTLYYFHAAPGDSWQFANENGALAEHALVVLDTGSSVLDGTLVHWLHVNINGMNQDTLFERLGGLKTYWIPWQYGFYTGTEIVLRCYSDQEMTYSTAIAPACDMVLGADGSTAVDSFRVYPNPAADQVTVQGAPTDAYSIRDGAGRIVQAGSFAAVPTRTIPLQGLRQGLYLLSLAWEGRWSHHRLLKR